MYISKYFKYSELIKSDQAAEHGIDNSPKDWKIIANLTRLASHLDSIREAFGAIVLVSSGYRCKATNQLPAISGQPNSFHLLGCAADIYSPGRWNTLVDAVLKHIGMVYQSGRVVYEDDIFEVILYPSRHFIHFAVKPTKNV